MKAAKVTLTVVEGYYKNKRYVFEQPSQCLLGRGNDCDIRLPGLHFHGDVSRHHCMLEIDPPLLRVRDLGSLNGTFVNDEMIGRRPKERLVEDTYIKLLKGRYLQTGDEIRIGHTVLRVEIEAEGDTIPPQVSSSS